MRVCYVTSTVQPTDGWGRYSRELLAVASAAGIEPVLVTVRHGGGDLPFAVERHDLLPPVLAGHCELPRSLAYTLALRRIASRCDLVHGLVEPWLPLVALATPRGMPLVQTAHGSWAVHPLRRTVVRRVFRRALARTDLLVCQSRVTRDAVLSLASPRSSEVLSGGVDPKLFAGRLGAPPPGWNSTGPVVLSVGALKPRKGHHVALEAFARVAATHSDLRWVVVGRESPANPFATELKRHAEGLGIGGRVHWLSDLTDEELVACYRRATMFVLLPVTDRGSFEGLGLVYLEAAAAGLPAVGTLGSGAVDAVVDGETGLLVPQNDAAAAADAIDRLLRAPELGERLGRTARARAADLSWARLASGLAARYWELAGRLEGSAPVEGSRGGAP